jgi:hypothetical protein
LPFDDILRGAVATTTELGFYGGTKRAQIYSIFERIIEDTILGVACAARSPLEAYKENAPELPMGSPLTTPSELSAFCRP